MTVNTEHEVKLDELSKTNNDMTNLLASTEIGTIFLDNELRIQRFTPAATRLVKLIQSDLGRPLSDIATHITDDNLVAEVNQVLDDLAPREKEVRTRRGQWYLVRVRPYRTTENIINGAVITFSDISDQKRVQEQLQALSQVIQQTPDTVLVLDSRGQIESVNPQYVEKSGFSVSEAVGRDISTIKSGKLSEADLKAMWQTVKDGNTWSGNLINRGKDGTCYTDRVSIYPMLDRQGRITHYVAVQTEVPNLDPYV